MFQQLIDVNQGLLSALGVSHRCLDQIASICLANGQLHAKLTGAGGGGFAFALITPFHTEGQVSDVKAELQSQGFECWDTNIAGGGIKVHSSWNFYFKFFSAILVGTFLKSTIYQRRKRKRVSQMCMTTKTQKANSKFSYFKLLLLNLTLITNQMFFFIKCLVKGENDICWPYLLLTPKC